MARDAPDYRPVHLELQLPDEVLNEPALQDEKSMFHQYGFNLKFSNQLPLHRTLPDIRMESCRQRRYPTNMPAVSVIIIFYNEALSTLLRNVMSVINLTPPELLGEIVMVNDNSSLPQLKYLPEHLDRLPPPGTRKKKKKVKKAASREWCHH